MTSSPEESPRHSKIYLPAFTVLALLLGAATFVQIILIPADQKNAVLWGFSLSRLLLLGLVALGELVLIGAAIAYIFNPDFKRFVSKRVKATSEGRIIGVIGSLMGIVALIPPEELGRWEAIYVRLHPLLALISLLLLLWALLVLLSSYQFAAQVKSWIQQKITGIRTIVAVSLGILLLLFGLAYLLYPGAANEDFWFENGVPILVWQILAALVIGWVYIRFEKLILRKLGGKTNMALFLSLFIFSGLLWALTPVGPSFFNPNPAPPNYQFYPFSDAQKYDLQAQSTLVGLGFNSGSSLDRPYYPLFLALIHLVSGQDYTVNVSLQAFLFGVFPAILFLICAEFGSRKWGVVSAAAAALWGQNHILVNSILNTATPKQILTDFPMVIPLSLVMYFTLRWLKGGRQAWINAFIAGGMIALAAYIRYSALALLPIWIIAMLVHQRRNPRQALITSGVVAAGFLVILLPWYARNAAVSGQFTIPFSQKIIFVIKDRYSGEAQSERPVTVARDNSSNHTTYGSVVPVVCHFPASNGQQVATDGNDLNKPFASWFTAHLVHNVISSVMILPSSLEMASIETSIERSEGISAQYWNGKFTALQMIIIFVELSLLSVGAAAIHRRNKWLLIFLLLLFFGVNLSNTLARTSGGRYIVPVNWVVLLIYFAGILYLLGQFTSGLHEQNESKPTKKGQKKWIGAVIALLLVGMLPVLFELITQQIFTWPNEDRSQVEVSQLKQYGVTDDLIEEIAHFQRRNDANLVMGYAYYPRQQEIGPTGRMSHIVGTGEEIPFLTFSFIEPGDSKQIALPYAEHVDIANQDLVILVGCKTSAQVIARDLFIVHESTLVHYQADPLFNKCK